MSPIIEESTLYCSTEHQNEHHLISTKEPLMTTPYQTPITPTGTRIGWVGIGVMGSAMASRLLSPPLRRLHSHHFCSYPIQSPPSPIPRRSYRPSLTHLAQQSDLIFTMLGHPSDVRQIVLENLVPLVQPNTILVDHTSSHPLLAKRIYNSALERGCFAIDAPVSGGDIGAKEGKLAIFVGGDEGVVDRLRPLFDVMGNVTYMGSAGKGQSCKIANQITVGANLLGLSEGFVFAEKAGLDKGRFMEAVKGGAAGSMVMELFGGRMIERDFRPGAFVEYMVKDLGMGVDVGEEEEGSGDDVVVLPGAALCKQLFSGMVANRDRNMGTQGLVTVIERLNDGK